MRQSKEIWLCILLGHFKKFIIYPEGRGESLKGLRGDLIRFALCGAEREMEKQENKNH